MVDGTPSVLQIYPAMAHGFHLCAAKLNSRLHALFHKVVMVGFFILCNCKAKAQVSTEFCYFMDKKYLNASKRLQNLEYFLQK